MDPRARHVRLFKNGRNQAVCIPREMELPGDEAVIYRDGQRLIIEPVTQRSLTRLISTWEPLDIEWPEVACGSTGRARGLRRTMTTRFLLDTNALSQLIRDPHGTAGKRLREVGHSNVYTSIISDCSPASTWRRSNRASILSTRRFGTNSNRRVCR